MFFSLLPTAVSDPNDYNGEHDKHGMCYICDGRWRRWRQAQELRVEIQQLKAKNHGLNTQMDALAADHERLASLLDTADKVCFYSHFFKIFFPCCKTAVYSFFFSFVCSVMVRWAVASQLST